MGERRLGMARQQVGHGLADGDVEAEQLVDRCVVVAGESRIAAHRESKTIVVHRHSIADSAGQPGPAAGGVELV